jgi:hypothetical protein
MLDGESWKGDFTIWSVHRLTGKGIRTANGGAVEGSWVEVWEEGQLVTSERVE